VPVFTPDTDTDTWPLPFVLADAGETVALVASLDAIVQARPVSGVLLTSRAVAVSDLESPTFTLIDDGETATEFTDGNTTRTTNAPLLPPLVAVMVVVPTATPVTENAT
jgi:hypothetical protein